MYSEVCFEARITCQAYLVKMARARGSLSAARTSEAPSTAPTIALARGGGSGLPGRTSAFAKKMNERRRGDEGEQSSSVISNSKRKRRAAAEHGAGLYTRASPVAEVGGAGVD